MRVAMAWLDPLTDAPDYPCEDRIRAVLTRTWPPAPQPAPADAREDP